MFGSVAEVQLPATKHCVQGSNEINFASTLLLSIVEVATKNQCLQLVSETSEPENYHAHKSTHEIGYNVADATVWTTEYVAFTQYNVTEYQ